MSLAWGDIPPNVWSAPSLPGALFFKAGTKLEGKLSGQTGCLGAVGLEARVLFRALGSQVGTLKTSAENLAMYPLPTTFFKLIKA